MDPWREEAHRQLMLLLARSGQRSAALRQYETCRRILADELGVEPGAETRVLYERIRAAESMRRDNLPPQSTPFIGREEELAEITARLAHPDCRLLTLVGSGGIGKTRLALQTAAHLAQSGTFLHGIAFVPLAPLGSSEFLVSNLAQSLAFSFSGRDDPKAQLLNYLREKEMLLVLDSFEHLLDGAGLLAEILQGAPEVKILVTSRERLNLRWEWIFEVEGLGYPDFRLKDARDTTDDLQSFDYAQDRSDIYTLKFPAVQMFVQSARRVHPRFSPAEENPSVVRICQLVEGMPLALEMAAAWVREYSCAEIARQIEHNLDFLASSLRDAPERHRNVRAVFDHSWSLLTEEQRRALEKLSVFRGGFYSEAAEQVSGASASLLSALTDKFLLRRSPSGRYDLHELLRQYVAEKLAAIPLEQERAHDSHCDYYADFLFQREGTLRGEKQKQVLAEMNEEIENVRAGWRCAVERRKDEALARSLDSLFVFYETRNLFQAGEQVFGTAVDSIARAENHADSRRQELLGRLLARQAVFSFRLSNYGKAKDLLRQSVAILRALDARAEMAFALNNLGNAAERLGEHAEARQLYQESLAICRELGDPWGIARALSNLGFIACQQGENREAQQLLEEALVIRRQIGDRAGIAKALINLGLVANQLQEFAAAKRFYQESLTIFQEMDNQLGFAICLNNLGYTAYNLKEYAEARELYQKGLAIRRELGDQWGIALALDNLGAVACEMGDYEASRMYFRQALKVAEEIGAVRRSVEVLVGMAALAAKQGQKEKAVELLALSLSHPAISQESKDKGQRLLTELESQLAPEVIAAVLEGGKGKRLEEVVEELTKRSG
jgi:predicted ATPase